MAVIVWFPPNPPPHPRWERLQELSPDRPGQMCAETFFFFSPTEWRNEKESKKEERGNAQNVRLSAWKATHMQNALLEVQCLTTHHIMQTQYRGRYRGRSGGKGGRARNEKMRRIQHVVRVCFQYTESWLMTLPYTTSWRQVHRILLTICFLFFFFKAVGSSTSDQKLRLLTGSFN